MIHSLNRRIIVGIMNLIKFVSLIIIMVFPEKTLMSLCPFSPYSLFFVLAISYSGINKAVLVFCLFLALLIVLGIPLLSVLLLIGKGNYRFLAIGITTISVLDMVCLLLSWLGSFHLASLAGIIFNLVIITFAQKCKSIRDGTM